MESLLTIMLHPERAKVQDSVRVLNNILADEIDKIDACFQTMRNTLNSQIAAAEELRCQLTEQNERLVTLTDESAKNLSVTSQRLDNTMLGLQSIVESAGWQEIQTTTNNFNSTINKLTEQINITSQNTADKVTYINEQIQHWIESGQTLSDNLQQGFTNNINQNTEMTNTAQELQNKLSELAQSTASEFDNVKTASDEYKSVLNDNNKLIDTHLTKLDTFSKQAKKQLATHVNALTNTANVVGGQVRLAESSIDQQMRKLADAIESMMAASASTENSVRSISTELATLTNRFNGEIKDFANDVVSEIKTVSGVANNTLENTKTAASAFSESVKTMASGVRDTLIKMNTAHSQLSGQSANLIKLSKETTAQLQPLSELIEKYYAALPDLSRGSIETSDNLNKIVTGLNANINMMKTTVAESTDTISASAVKLDDLASQSRQQMIDLMSDYAKAVNTMQTLNKQMMVARAAAPMDAISTTPNSVFSTVNTDDFLKQSERTFSKMHEQSLDLIRAMGAEIPDVVWKKYHEGDSTVFSKWLLKILKAADKKHIHEMLKNDTVFKSQTTQFVRSFDKILNSAKNVDTSDKLSATLIKTDLGQVYIILKAKI